MRHEATVAPLSTAIDFKALSVDEKACSKHAFIFQPDSSDFISFSRNLCKCNEAVREASRPLLWPSKSEKQQVDTSFMKGTATAHAFCSMLPFESCLCAILT